jgi:succinyl-diaminopimelate desuccinylase
LKAKNQEVEECLKQCEKDLVSFCSRLVQGGGENPPGDVSGVVEVIETFLGEHEIAFKKLEQVKGHDNIIATIGKGKPKIILCGHIDVVPGGGSQKLENPTL